MRLRDSILLLGCLAALLISPPAQAEWKAGAARIKITPDKLMWMSGYASRKTPATGTLHDLWAKALVLEDEQGTKAVLVTLDLVGLDQQTSELICVELSGRHKLPRAAIALCSSHTHTGPVVGTNLGSMYRTVLDETQQQLVKDYAEGLVRDVVQVVGDALKKLAPAKLSHGSGQADFAVNRRNNREPDVPALRQKGLLKGPVDHAVPVLTVRNLQGELLAIACGYACHATALSFYQWSGDWPGFAQIALEKAHPEAIALFWAGCGADQNPIPRRTVELAEQYGRQLAEAVTQVIKGEMKPITGKLRLAYTEIELPFATLPTREQLQADAKDKNVYVAARAEMLLEHWKQNGQLAKTYPYPVQLWRLGESVDFAILGGEVVVDYAIRLKTEWPKDNLWVAGYSNDVMAYVPSRRVLKEGGYEGATSMIYYGQPTVWSPEVEELIISTVHKLAGSKGERGASAPRSR